jgi:hypothetical protein
MFLENASRLMKAQLTLVVFITNFLLRIAAICSSQTQATAPHSCRVVASLCSAQCALPDIWYLVLVLDPPGFCCLPVTRI